ncbi:sensor histidine kinase [Sphingomonas glaciei]|uniref:histidine kinase n=1 Tax=Sphingomonas glaciei TaxID=2938948 RepID=A0ABY5MU42_9SPHN|nr:ATP-binding protein [Sphingomonas glaciei]UUR07612.1 HAMP domain-containing histidine kinase [Sphingomonas glaciei]
MPLPPLVLALLDALEEPALLVSGERTQAANAAARVLLGRGLVDQDVRFAIRQPHALDAIRHGRAGRFEVVGIGGVDRSFEVVITELGDGLLLVRLVDRSARRAAERAQVDFVANASHELRTPLAAVLGFSETLTDEAPLAEGIRRRFGQQIHSQATRMMVIIRDLMSLSRIEADRFSVPGHSVALEEIAREAVSAAAPLADSRSCTIEFDPGEASALVRGDAPQLRQMLDNLLGNAVRYGCAGTGGRIRVALSSEGEWHRLGVRDWGEGVDARHLPRLTERFFRVDAARSRDGGGTGLGLAIVAQIVERHRGLLQIRSTPGEGTEVEVRLPRA